jgi:hypothetical protein
MATEVCPTSPASVASAELHLLRHVGGLVRRCFNSQFVDELRARLLLAT